jgi:FMN phosphatase YigB (HAD superfamily)
MNNDNNIEVVNKSGILTDKEESCDIKAVIFDLGNVLVDFDHRLASESISHFTDRPPEDIFNLFFDSKLTGLFEEGKISPRQFFAEVRNTLNLKINYYQFVPIWNEIFFFTEKNLGVYKLACNLKSIYKFAVLSNINILHLEYIKRTFPILNALQIIASYELGLRKPHVEIYQKVLQMLGVASHNVFYADDRAELVEIARRLGMRSFIFKDVEGLKNNLINTGINIR